MGNVQLNMFAPSPPPWIVNDGLIIVETNYAEVWEKAELPYLSNHRGILRLLLPSLWRGVVQNNFHHPLILTRGMLPCGCDAVELFFPVPNGFHLYIPAFQSNRLPGDPCGKRHWELEVWFPLLPPIMQKCYDVAWRTGPLPCLLPWEGEYPKFHAAQSRKEKRASRSDWLRENKVPKPGSRARRFES